MGDDRYKLIDVEQGKLPDVCRLVIPINIQISRSSGLGFQEVDILTLVAHVNGNDENCAEALKELVLAIAEGLLFHYPILTVQLTFCTTMNGIMIHL